MWVQKNVRNALQRSGVQSGGFRFARSCFLFSAKTKQERCQKTMIISITNTITITIIDTITITNIITITIIILFIAIGNVVLLAVLRASRRYNSCAFV